MDTPLSPERSSGLVRITLWTIAVCLALPFIFAALFASSLKAQAKTAQATVEVQQIAEAVKAYRREYGFQPLGSNAEVIKTLRGDNPRKIVFFEARPQDFTAAGEMVDPWGTPLLLNIRDGEEPQIHSSGPDRKDNAGAAGSDDIISWQSK